MVIPYETLRKMVALGTPFQNTVIFQKSACLRKIYKNSNLQSHAVFSDFWLVNSHGVGGGGWYEETSKMFTRVGGPKNAL